MNKPKISIVTSVYNGEKYIKDTIESVLNQKALKERACDLEYIIIDGKSTDNTIQIINSFNDKKIKLISENDNGLYDGLSKGLKIATGDIVSYLNSDDIYFPWTFSSLLNIFKKKDVKWVTGISSCINSSGIMYYSILPYKYRTNFIQKGIYGSKLPYIQQESTFWTKELNESIDFNKLKKFKLAGDYFLWYSFSKLSELHIAECNLAAFRIREGQLSKNLSLYKNELNSITTNSCKIDPQINIDELCWYLPNSIKIKLNPRIIKFSEKT